MQALDQTIIDALQDLLSREATFMECTHTQEHYWQSRGYKKLKKWFDSLVSDSRDRKRRLIDRLFQYDGVTVAIATASVYAWTNVPDAFSNTLNYLTDLNTAYQNALVICEKASDETNIDLLNDAQYVVQKSISKFEARSKQLADLGPAVYLSTLI